MSLLRRPFGVVLLVLAGCAPADRSTPPGDTFDPVSDDAPRVAEETAYATLFAAGGPAVAKAVTELRTLRVDLDPTDIAHTHVRQHLDGVPVWGSEAIVHVGRDGVLGVTDDLLADVAVDTRPLYTADDAIDLAVAGLASGWEDLTDAPRADLWVLRHDGADHLVWRVRLHHVNLRPDDAIPVRFVDAHTGDLVWAYDDLQTAATTCTGDTNYYGNVGFGCYGDGTYYFLEDPTDPVATYSWMNTFWSLSAIVDTSPAFDAGGQAVFLNAIEAHYVAEAVLDYYAVAHGRDGIDGAGGPGATTSHGTDHITSTTSYSRNYVNAYWDTTNLWIVYGDGDGVNASSLTTLDVAGHELTHGVTQYSANLTYAGESGGINESVSDVFGALVERSLLGESAATWTVAEETWTPATAGDALRYLDDPALDGASYDYYVAGIGSADVHYSSGVGNLAFYLLSEGGTHPRGKSTTVVAGIGADAAAAIWYLALTQYMTSGTDYLGARTATLNAAAQLHGAGSVEHAQVAAAWTAVGVGSATTCTDSGYAGSFSRTGRTNYHPGKGGVSVTVPDQEVALAGPAGSDFDLALQKKSGRSWTTVASATGPESSKALTYAGTSGTYRVAATSRVGTGAYTVEWCK